LKHTDNCQCKIADILDRYETQIKQDALYIERQATTGGNDKNTPYYRGVKLSFQFNTWSISNLLQLPSVVVKYIDRPQSIVDPIATPYYKGVGISNNLHSLVANYPKIAHEG
jgi:hypothetical protein